MTVPTRPRWEGEHFLRRWLDLNETIPQADLPAADTEDMGWVKLARCGPWREDAPDPELFHPVEADLVQTYVAQGFCIDCEVRHYCDSFGDWNRMPGIWGGIYRNAQGHPAVLCVNAPRCMRFAAPRHLECRQCIRAKEALVRIRAGKQDGQPEPETPDHGPRAVMDPGTPVDVAAYPTPAELIGASA